MFVLKSTKYESSKSIYKVVQEGNLDIQGLPVGEKEWY